MSSSKQERERKQHALQDASVTRLRELLSSAEGSIAAKQLVQGATATAAELECGITVALLSVLTAR